MLLCGGPNCPCRVVSRRGGDGAGKIIGMGRDGAAVNRQRDETRRTKANVCGGGMQIEYLEIYFLWRLVEECGLGIKGWWIEGFE